MGWFSYSNNSALREGTSHAEQKNEELLSQMLAFNECQGQQAVFGIHRNVFLLFHVTKSHTLVSEGNAFKKASTPFISGEES